MAELGNKELSGRVIEAAIAVHSAPGPGFLESVDENALAAGLFLNFATAPLAVKRAGPGRFIA